jgi:hypothetical protein
VAQALMPNATYFSQNLGSGKNCGAGWHPARIACKRATAVILERVE